MQYTLTHFAAILHTGCFHFENGSLTPYEENPEYNPLFQDRDLREYLIKMADSQAQPAVFRDEYQVYFVCVRKDSAYTLMGPFSTVQMNRVERHRFYRNYGIEEKWEKGLRYFTLMEVLQITGMLAKLVTGEEYTDQMLVDANYHAGLTIREEQTEQIHFDIRSDEEDLYRHTYQEERRILEAVREGDAEEAVRLSKEMDADVGRLGKKELDHWRNLTLISATLCARAAIEGGVNPAAAYRLSGFYINKASASRDVTQILVYRNHAVKELAEKVKEEKSRRCLSGYTKQCRDYIYRHYREKIYLEDIAGMLGLSSSYLSRLFKKEEGISLQDFVNAVRVEKAANLLIYSDEPISRIAEYVNFPSQSYFGQMFRRKMNMTPRQYREMYKPTEFIAHEE